MPAPRPAVIVLLLVLVAIVVFFIVGQSLGAQQPAGPSEAEISSLKDRFFGGAPGVQWRAGDRCPQVSPVRPCVLNIPEGSGLMRKVSVKTDKPMLIDFVPASSPDRTINLDLTEKYSDPAELFVDSKGGRLTLKCKSPDPSKPCAVTVK